MESEARSLYGDGRMSAQRALIAEAVSTISGAFTAEELHREVLRRSPGIGLATVYRALGAMQTSGAVEAVGERHGSALLVLCGRGDHHHHLVCTSCGSVTGIDCPLDEEVLAAARRQGHSVTRHEIALYGVCARCRRNGPEE